MAAFNGEKYIRQQIISILSQLGPTDELIISDNGSTDDTLNIINEFCDARINFLICAASGVINNFEFCLNHAKGDFIFLADQDDIWAPLKVQTTMSLLERANLVVSDAYIVDQDLLDTGASVFGLRGSRRGLVYNIYRNSFMGCCMAFDRKVLNLCLPFPKSISMHDQWIGLVTETYGLDIEFCEDKLIYYRRHLDNQTGLHSDTSLTTQLKWRYDMCCALFWKRWMFYELPSRKKK